MPIYAIVIKKADGSWYTVFKLARSHKKLNIVVKEKLAGTKHELQGIHYVLPDPNVWMPRPYKRRNNAPR